MATNGPLPTFSEAPVAAQGAMTPVDDRARDFMDNITFEDALEIMDEADMVNVVPDTSSRK